MRPCLKSLLLALILAVAPVPSLAVANGLVAVWHFDEGSGRQTTEMVSLRLEPQRNP
jgi:hypothetical protein